MHGTPPPPRRLLPAAAILVAWLVAGVTAGVRLHLEGGVFGEVVPLGVSVATRLVEALPWTGAAGVAWWAAGRWRPSRHDLLRPVTVHAWVGLATVVIVQVAVAALRAAWVPPGLRPFDPWGALPGELTRRGPPALLVYGALLVVALAWRSGSDPHSDQEVPAAGRGAEGSS